ncbi:MAG: endonuclease domain-containing protein [Bacteroidota bacterium]|jgi:very-short-patch-repair endonuclease
MSEQIIKIGTELGRDLRKRLTQSEQLFWEAVRNKQFMGLKFLRQHPIFFEYINKPAFFIADFYCHQHRLVIEIDGKSHDYQKEYDEFRTFIINNLGIEVFRINNEEIRDDIQGVLKKITTFISKRTHPMVPL